MPLLTTNIYLCRLSNRFNLNIISLNSFMGIPNSMRTLYNTSLLTFSSTAVTIHYSKYSKSVDLRTTSYFAIGRSRGRLSPLRFFPRFIHANVGTYLITGSDQFLPHQHTYSRPIRCYAGLLQAVWEMCLNKAGNKQQ